MVAMAGLEIGQDYIGLRFGKLTVLRQVPAPLKNGKAKHGTYYLCRCDCGVEVVAKRQKVRLGLRATCGASECRKPPYEKQTKRCSRCCLRKHISAFSVYNRKATCDVCVRPQEPGLSDFRKFIAQKYGCMNPNCRWDGELPSQLIEFHHKDPKTKLFNIGRWTCETSSLPPAEKKPKLLAEIEKCMTLCSNCHRLVHAKILEDQSIPTIELLPSDLAYFDQFKKTVFCGTLDNKESCDSGAGVLVTSAEPLGPSGTPLRNTERISMKTL
jgi:hypothetical protein